MADMLVTIKYSSLKKGDNKIIDDLGKQMEPESPLTSAGSDMIFTAFSFDRKRRVSESVLDVKNTKKCLELIDKSLLIVFSVKEGNRSLLLDMLFDLGKMRRHYGLIIEVEKDSLYYFPQLNYGDSYLMKNVFQEKFIEQKIDVILGKLAI